MKKEIRFLLDLLNPFISSSKKHDTINEIKIDTIYVPYDIKNTCSDIEEEDFNTKSKILSWIGK